MIHTLLTLLAFQLGGEAAARTLSLPVPGPVLGMVALAACLAASPRLMALMRPLAEGILAHLSLLFVPAGVGVVGHLSALGAMGPGLMLAPKSTTAPVAIGISGGLGGSPTLTAVLVILTGVTGAMIATPLLNALGLTDWRARGFATGWQATASARRGRFRCTPWPGPSRASAWR